MNKLNKKIEINRHSWEDRTAIHLKSDFYDLESFKKDPMSLKSIELEAMGDVKGKSFLHLQCHFGQDSLSWAKKGADVTAVDFSPAAISAAKGLSKELNIEANFVESNVLTLDLEKEFDIIFMSYGTLGWLPDLKLWGSIVAKHLKQGGTFLLVEFHPVLDILDDKTQHPYFFDENTPTTLEMGSYTDGGEDMKTEYCWWNHSLSEIFVALESNGLKLQSFEEFDYSPYFIKGTVERQEGQYVLKNRAKQSLPYVFSLKATKK
jgi:ubiquinone/menaquinone biosynthesis C-methylase UbiE